VHDSAHSIHLVDDAIVIKDQLKIPCSDISMHLYMLNSIINDLIVILNRWTAVCGLSRAVFCFKSKQNLWKSV